MNSKEKKEARVERYKALAAGATAKSSAAYQQASKMLGVIPPGQPVHGLADRRYRERISGHMDKSVKLADTAEYFEGKAEAAEKNNAIYLGDDDCVERLQERLDELVKLQDNMKAANKIVKSQKLSNEQIRQQLSELGFSDKQINEVLTPSFTGKIGFASCTLTNNNRRISDTKKRLEQAKKMKTTENKEYYVGEVRFVENSRKNRLQLFFPEIPDKALRQQMSNNGFRWCSSNGCWQSYLKRYNIRFAKELLAPKEADTANVPA